MIGGDPAPMRLRLLGSLSLVLATVIALVNLPAEELPGPWLLAFTIPGAILGSWSRLARAPWRRAVFAIALQAGACYGALLWVGPMTRPAALACTILPPLAFSTTRNHDSDPSLALFLSFCVMLVGVILDGMNMLLLVPYGAVAFLSLHVATLLHGHRICNPRSTSPSSKPSPVRVADGMATSLMMLSCMVAVFAIDRTLSCLPSPSRVENSDSGNSAASNNRQVGLDDSFILDGPGGILSELTGEQLVRASLPGIESQSVPSNLYLRCGFFSEPGMDRWRIGERNLLPQARAGVHDLRPALRSEAIRSLKIERFSGAGKFVFLLPYSLRVQGLDDLVIDPIREWIRPKTPSNDPYLVRYQDLPEPERGMRLGRRSRELGMTELPPTLDLDQFEKLLSDWNVSDEPLQAMAAIADGLASHASYSRREPVGPFRHTIENFLFAEGERHGYCMHFASAAALMLRLRGIPCRIGVGLYGGEVDQTEADDDVPGNTTQGARIFGSQHAHAWVEVPFEDLGYVVFDPTPPDSRGRATALDSRPANASDANVGIRASVIEPTVRAIRKAIATPWTWAIVLAVVLLLAILPRRQPTAPTKNTGYAIAPKARRALQKLMRALAKSGHRRTRGQTLELFADDLEEHGPEASEVRTAFAAYQEVRFGGRDFDAERAQLMESGVHAATALRKDEQ